MKTWFYSFAAAVAGVVLLTSNFWRPTVAAHAAAGTPQFTADGMLVYPTDYREWIYLSSGLGMSYGPIGSQAPPDNPPFDNVFVSPAAYRSFLATGRWPNGTVFILELRSSQSKGSINQGGSFQGELLGAEAEVKDDRIPGQWGFYGFGRGTAPAKQIPATASCYSCHAKHGAVEQTFVQFYPTLLAVARQKGTIRPEAAAEPLRPTAP